MEPNKLENDFKEKLEQRRIQPSEMAWDRLDAMLSVTENKKPKKKRMWLYMAAALLVFLLAGVLFLNQEKQNKGVDNNNSVVTAKEHEATPNNTVEPQNTEAPVITEEVVAVQTQSSAVQAKKANLGKQALTPVNNRMQHVAVANNEVASPKDKEAQNTVQQTTAENLLASAMVNTDAPKKKSTIKVDPNSLLSSVEGELNENYRSKAFQGVVKSFNTVKVAVANRNYE